MNRAIFWPLVGVMLVAIGLRVWALNWGLPYLYEHDESDYVVISQRIFKTGDLNPHHFNYGSAFFYINALAYIPYYLVGWVDGGFHTPDDIAYPTKVAMGVGITSMPDTFLLERSVTLLFGVASVYLVFLIGRRVTGRATVGLIAAFLIAISPTSVKMSRDISPNMFLVFFALLTILGAVKIYQENTTSAYVLSGVAAGLAAGTKYNGGLALGVVLLACLLRNGWPALKERKLYLAVALSAATFLITTPFALLDFSTFMRDLISEARHYSTGHAGQEGNTVAWYATFLWTQEGIASVLGCIGVVYALMKRSKPLIIVASFSIVYGIFISTFVVRNDQTILPLLPFLFILAAVIIADAARWLIARGLNTKIAVAGGVALILLISIVPLNVTSATAIQHASPDSRLTGVQWIKENIPPGSKVGIEVGSPYLDPQIYSVQPVGAIIAHTTEWYVQERYDYLVFAWDMFGRFYREPDKYQAEVAQYDAFFSRFPMVKELTDGGYDVKIYKVTAR